MTGIRDQGSEGGVEAFLYSPARVFCLNGSDFADKLAKTVLDRFGSDLLTLADVRIFLPTRRACRVLQEAFLRQSGGQATILPRLLPLGGEEDFFVPFINDRDPPPPAISDLRREIILSQLIKAQDQKLTTPQALRLAHELALLIDQMHTDRVDFRALNNLVPENLAEHWQKILAFLRIAGEFYPQILKEENKSDPAFYRDAMLYAQAEYWRANPPSYPVIAAGSTASHPAVANLLAVITNLPQGMVVLPGLDRFLSDKAWAALDITHPQYGMREFLAKIGRKREEVPDLVPFNPRKKGEIISQIMLPAEFSGQWREIPPLDPEDMTGFTLITAEHPGEEALVIAIALREVLETPGKTGMLVTPDRDLAGRVTNILKRWEVEIDDSAGTPLGQSLSGAWLTLSAEADNPLKFLAFLQHPFSHQEAKPHLWRLDLALRGPISEQGLDFLPDLLEGEAKEWLAALLKDLEPFFTALQSPAIDFRNIWQIHVELGQKLGKEQFWSHELVELHQNIQEDGEIIIPGREYAGIISLLFDRISLRKTHSHPRLSILGPLEARLMSADRVVLSGLNEGVWPPTPDPGPWMSRPMRKASSLTLPERRIGLSAHDFAQALCGEDVIITRALKADGTPTTPSRFIARLEAVLEAGGILGPIQEKWQKTPWLYWAQNLDAAERQKSASTYPCPPLEARPLSLYVTDIEKLRRNPYDIYAKHILRLKELEPLNADPKAKDYGNCIHKALEEFFRQYPGPLPPNPYETLLALGEERMREDFARHLSLLTFWGQRWKEEASFIISLEKERRAQIRQTFCEKEGAIKGEFAPGQEFTLKARADRVDLYRDNSLGILDYKTGDLPTMKSVRAGYAPQLPLEAAIGKQGGFKDLPGSHPVNVLEFIQLNGKKSKSQDLPEAETLAQEAWKGTLDIIRHYMREDTPYYYHKGSDFAPKYSPYEHLARTVQEEEE